MFSKAVFTFFVQAFLAQVALSQYFHPCGENAQAVFVPSVGTSSCDFLGANGLAYGGRLGYGSDFDAGIGIANGYGAGLNALSIEATRGGSFPVQSASYTAPTGISVASENAYEGCLNVIGELPFLSVVALEGVTPSAGAGVVYYNCGNGVAAIRSEISNGAGAFGIGSADAIGTGSAGIGANAIGCGTGIGVIPLGAVYHGHAEGHPCGCGLY